MPNPSYISENRIDFFILFKTLINEKVLILIITSLFFILGYIYSNSLPTPPYQISSLIITPSDSTILEINKLDHVQVTAQVFLQKFLSNIESNKNRISVYLTEEPYYQNKFNSSLDQNSSEYAVANSFVSSVKIHRPKLTKTDVALKFANEIPYKISITGLDPDAMKEYLRKLIEQSNKSVLYELKDLTNMKINNEIYRLTNKKQFQLEKITADRYADIYMLKENKLEKTDNIINAISRAKISAKQNRLNEIIRLKESVILAESMGIAKNSFNLLLVEAPSASIPEWYLYGSNALTERVRVLEKRIDDDAFIPNLVQLNENLEAIRDDNRIETLESRNDSLYFKQNFYSLDSDIRKLELELLRPDSLNYDGVRVLDYSLVQEVFKYNRQKIMLLMLFLGFSFSILIALIKDAITRRISSVS
tara:strand:+ start:2298 stop:3560 length:1263 start_codon:yes stop_codon:yes gene_type:complete